VADFGGRGLALIGDSQDPKAPEILSNILYNLAVVYERSRDGDRTQVVGARVMYRQFDDPMATLVAGWAGSGPSTPGSLNNRRRLLRLPWGQKRPYRVHA